MARLRPYFPKSHGVPSVDDQRILSGIIFINRNGLRWCDAPKEYGPSKALYNRWKRWNDMGVFARIMEDLAAEAPGNKRSQSTRLTSKLIEQRPAYQLKRRAWASDRSRQRGYEYQASCCDGHDCTTYRFFMTAGQVSDYTGARALVSSLPAADWLLGPSRDIRCANTLPVNRSWL